MSASRTDALPIARRYATAIFEQAATAGKQAQVTEEFAALARAFAENKELASAFANPLVTRAQKAAVLQALVKSGDALTRQSVKTVAEGGRGELIPLIAELLQARLREERGELTAEVTSARPLSTAVQKKLTDALATATGKKVQLQLTEDPAVLGGMAVQLGSLRLDATLSGALGQMRQALQKETVA